MYTGPGDRRAPSFRASGRLTGSLPATERRFAVLVAVTDGAAVQMSLPLGPNASTAAFQPRSQPDRTKREGSRVTSLRPRDPEHGPALCVRRLTRLERVRGRADCGYHALT
jgi:hypothetical protein